MHAQYIIAKPAVSFFERLVKLMVVVVEAVKVTLEVSLLTAASLPVALVVLETTAMV